MGDDQSIAIGCKPLFCTSAPIFIGVNHQTIVLLSGLNQERAQRDSNSSGIPAIEITKEAATDVTYISDDSEYQDGASSGGGSGRRRSGPPPQQQQVRDQHNSGHPSD